MRVAVTAEDIATGVRFHSRKCPLAKAFSRAFGRECAVGTFTWVRVPGGPNNPSTPLPPEAAIFAARFDAGFYVEPIAFDAVPLRP